MLPTITHPNICPVPVLVGRVLAGDSQTAHVHIGPSTHLHPGERFVVLCTPGD